MINLIPQESKIKVYWDDRPENYSKEGKVRVKNYFANKYSVNKNNGTNEDDNLICLCPNCHRMIHSNLISENDLNEIIENRTISSSC